MWYTKGGCGLQNFSHDLQAFHFSIPSKMLAMPLNVKITACQEVIARHMYSKQADHSKTTEKTTASKEIIATS